MKYQMNEDSMEEKVFILVKLMTDQKQILANFIGWSLICQIYCPVFLSDRNVTAPLIC